MDNFDETFIKNYCKECFSEFLSDVSMNLKRENRNYKKELEQREKVLDSFPNIREIIENDISMDLTKAEVGAFIEYLKSYYECKDIEEREIFFRGMREAYYLFKKMKLIQD